jgi:hypothetical protein
MMKRVIDRVVWIVNTCDRRSVRGKLQRRKYAAVTCVV